MTSITGTAEEVFSALQLWHLQQIAIRDGKIQALRKQVQDQNSEIAVLQAQLRDIKDQRDTAIRAAERAKRSQARYRAFKEAVVNAFPDSSRSPSPEGRAGNRSTNSMSSSGRSPQSKVKPQDLPPPPPPAGAGDSFYGRSATPILGVSVSGGAAALNSTSSSARRVWSSPAPPTVPPPPPPATVTARDASWSIESGRMDTSGASPTRAKGMKRASFEPKEFFRSAHSVLSKEKWEQLLSIIKQLNHNKISGDEAIEEAALLFGPDDKELVIDFSVLVEQRKQTV
eukprot:Clim_evm15s12 gene=Clim_evmTU15s12